jgi:phosphatidylserine decarboxylase
VAKEGYLIAIVMTPMDMHFQKAPCDCRVMGTRHVHGKFLNAVSGAGNLKATFENEHNTILLDTRHGRMKVIQIAGFLCRRILCFVRPGQGLWKGQDLGLIRLGSQVCLIMPKLRLRVKEGQHVLARSTVIAEPWKGR